jgi:metal-sulfur cluster biosynthetic enzyme
MGPVLVEDVKTRVGKLPGVKRVDVDLVFDPPWNQGLMSEAAKLTLGML